jgi:hypothetical protein
MRPPPATEITRRLRICSVCRERTATHNDYCYGCGAMICMKCLRVGWHHGGGWHSLPTAGMRRRAALGLRRVKR